MIIHGWIDKKDIFPKPCTCGIKKIKVELGLSNYAIKANLKQVAGVDASKFVKKTDLASLKSDFDILYIDILETTPVDLSKLT